MRYMDEINYFANYNMIENLKHDVYATEANVICNQYMWKCKQLLMDLNIDMF